MHILILAGGGGTRLWPLSRHDFPKQFLHFGTSLSLLQNTVNRFLHLPNAETITVATNYQNESLVKQHLSKIDPHQKAKILLEPARRNTAPAIAFAIQYLQEELKIPDSAFLLVVPSDHLIEPQTVLTRYIEQIEPLTRKGHLILFGIRPTKPETGFGYIQIGEQFDHFTHRVKRFVEKPDRKTAETYLASGDYYWNAGMFAFSLRLFRQELATHAPQLLNILDKGLESTRSHYSTMPDISFDYAILEKSSKTLVCPLPVTWSDVGSWDSVYDVLPKDSDQNVKIGNVHTLNTKNSLIFGGKKLISTIGVEDLLIVETDDAIFISKKGESQKVKDLVSELLKRGRSDKLSSLND